MAKKGATQSGGGKGREKERNAKMARLLPPSPKTWRRNAWDWPYHNNKGTKHKK